MTDDRPIGELLDMIGKRPPAARYEYDRKANERKQHEFDTAKSEIERRVRDAEYARSDAEAYRSQMSTQAARIAELEADNARLLRASEIELPKPRSGSKPSGFDPEPQPGDGPDYHADHAAWTARQASPSSSTDRSEHD